MPTLSLSIFFFSEKGPVAIKVINIKRQQRRRLIIKEIEILRDLDHKNMVNFVEGVINLPNELWVVMEYMDAGMQ